MAAEFRDVSNETVDVIEESNGGLPEHREDLGVVAERNPAIHNAITHLLNLRHPDCGGLLDTLRDLSLVFGGQSDASALPS
jgi:hypothetical protein